MRKPSPRLFLLFTPLLAAGVIGCDRTPPPQAALTAPTIVSGREEEALEHARKILSQDEDTRRDAFRALADLKSEAAPAIPKLIEALANPERKLQRTAAQVLGLIGEPAVVPLRESFAFSAEDPILREGIVEALGEVGAPARAAKAELLAAISAEESTVRAAAALALGKVYAREGIPDHIKTISIQNEQVADIARFVVGKGDKGLSGVQTVNPKPGAQRKLLDAFGVPTHDVGPLSDEGNQTAVLTLAIGGGDKEVAEAVEVLRALLAGEESTFVRSSAAQGLGRIGPAAGPARKELIAALYEDDPGLRKNAAWALGELGELGKEAIPHLQMVYRRSTPEVQSIILDTLDKLSK